eukprot:2902870-Alexandrium_andersonii.AAC.1
MYNARAAAIAGGAHCYRQRRLRRHFAALPYRTCPAGHLGGTLPALHVGRATSPRSSSTCGAASAPLGSAWIAHSFSCILAQAHV